MVVGIARSYDRAMFVPSGDIQLHLAIDGDAGAPPLLLLHGILGNGRTWEWMLPRLGDRFRVLRLDFRGHGESDRAPGRYQTADYVADAIAACEAAIGIPALVIGHSLGGVTAAALAQRRPDLVRAILLEDAPLAARADRSEPGDDGALLDAFARLRDGIPKLQAAGVSADQVAGIIRASPGPTGELLGDLLCDDAIATMADANLTVDASVLDHVLAGTMEPAFDPTRPIAVPVVAIAADPASPDAVTRPDDLAQLVATSPDVDTVTLSGATHLIHDSTAQREPFWSIVDAFLARRS